MDEYFPQHAFNDFMAYNNEDNFLGNSVVGQQWELKFYIKCLKKIKIEDFKKKNRS